MDSVQKKFEILVETFWPAKSVFMELKFFFFLKFSFSRSPFFSTNNRKNENLDIFFGFLPNLSVSLNVCLYK